VPFRGTPMGTIRKIVHDVWDGERLDGLPRETKIDIALAQFGQRYCEDKLAGVLMLSERLMEDIRSEDVELLARPLTYDTSTTGTPVIGIASRCLAASLKRRIIDGERERLPRGDWLSCCGSDARPR
jgi:hypothetical protein